MSSVMSAFVLALAGMVSGSILLIMVWAASSTPRVNYSCPVGYTMYENNHQFVCISSNITPINATRE